MELYINRRIRDKAMVFGLPAERFMVCFILICTPILIVVFSPIFIPIWILWGLGVYKYFQKMDSLSRKFTYGKQYPAHLKNR